MLIKFSIVLVSRLKCFNVQPYHLWTDGNDAMHYIMVMVGRAAQRRHSFHKRNIFARKLMAYSSPHLLSQKKKRFFIVMFFAWICSAVLMKPAHTYHFNTFNGQVSHIDLHKTMKLMYPWLHRIKQFKFALENCLHEPCSIPGNLPGTKKKRSQKSKAHRYNDEVMSGFVFLSMRAAPDIVKFTCI